MVDQAEIHRKTVSLETGERQWAVEQLRSNFADLPDKEEAWKDLIQLTQDKDIEVRWSAADALGFAFQHVPDKKAAWEDLIQLTQDKDIEVRWSATDALGFAFQHVPDKKAAWRDLHRLIQDEDLGVRSGAAGALGSAFQHVPDKKAAWRDLHRLIQDEDLGVRSEAAGALGSAFQHVPDKKAAWRDLHQLIQDEDWAVRESATDALGSVFQHVPDKEEAWRDLHRLTQDKNNYVRRRAAGALGSAFQHVPDKEAAWKDLHKLTQDKDSGVRRRAAGALGSAFQHVPDKEAAWKDLHKLTQDKNRIVQVNANHSLGKASIFKATKAQSDFEFMKEMENAIEFFERSSNEAKYFNPSKFCLPFYRSFYTVIFKKEGAEDEIQRYLTDAKDATKGSKNKETLIKAVENLANALSEARKVTDFDAMKSNLKAYRQYCDSAADLINDVSKEAPGAAQVLQHGLPIIDEQKKEIKEKARAVCKQTQDTPLEELGQDTARSAHELPTQDTVAQAIAMDNMASTARDWCEYLPTDKKINACEQLKNIKNMENREKAETISKIFDYVQKNIHIPKIQTIKISEIKQEIVRIAISQISFDLTESFPFTAKNKKEVKRKIFSTLDISKKNCANIVCLPELCLYEEWINEIKEKYPDMIVIGGSFYKDNKNICPLITKSDRNIPYQQKITPSNFEYPIMEPEERMIPGDTIYRYETQFGKFIILICRDFDDLAHYFRGTNIDMIFCPAFNPANKRFQNEAHSHVERTPSYILIANTGLYGGTSIFGQLNNDYFRSLVDGGCKDAKDLTYKLCEVKKGQEEVIIADFNLKHKNVQRQTPSNPDEEIRSVEKIRKLRLF
ncbi:MAG: hypothetical protein AEth_00270 [Candidatus Argoarchaeum ethanivorans]|uniref:CN hydrolase domain-containing protein n=1 Tax=Candidatus Argoarchaeum ethanivorans TaxID=2608793 RepID=A0A8B3S3S8_9EURY|nr:MAG: hypothetical protein AEth_00270 [Candidatus Argoarchaeum ethanivorans]